MSIHLHMVCMSPARHRITVPEGKSVYENCPAKVKPSSRNGYQKICTRPLQAAGMEYRCDETKCKKKLVQKHWQDKLDVSGWIEYSSTTMVGRGGEFVIASADRNIHFCSQKCKSQWLADGRILSTDAYEEIKNTVRKLSGLPPGEYVIKQDKGAKS